MSIVNILGGGLLLALGRKIFWFFVAGLGFFAGFGLATQYLKIQPFWVALLIGVAVGLVGALLAHFFQSLAIGAAGFFAGSYITSRLAAPLLPAQEKSWEWWIILIGGIIGIILMYIIFEWALIILSSLAGTMLLVEGFKLAGLVAVIVGVVLFAAGVIFQANINRRDRSRKETAK
jgi:hypothetical protein